MCVYVVSLSMTDLLHKSLNLEKGSTHNGLMGLQMVTDFLFSGSVTAIENLSVRSSEILHC